MYDFIVKWFYKWTFIYKYIHQTLLVLEIVTLTTELLFSLVMTWEPYHDKECSGYSVTDCSTDVSQERLDKLNTWTRLSVPKTCRKDVSYVSWWRNPESFTDKVWVYKGESYHRLDSLLKGRFLDSSPEVTSYVNVMVGLRRTEYPVVSVEISVSTLRCDNFLHHGRKYYITLVI